MTRRRKDPRKRAGILLDELGNERSPHQPSPPQPQPEPAPDQPEQCHFLHLPREVRHLIYSKISFGRAHVVTEQQQIQRLHDDHPGFCPVHPIESQYVHVQRNADYTTTWQVRRRPNFPYPHCVQWPKGPYMKPAGKHNEYWTYTDECPAPVIPRYFLENVRCLTVADTHVDRKPCLINWEELPVTEQSLPFHILLDTVRQMPRLKSLFIHRLKTVAEDKYLNDSDDTLLEARKLMEHPPLKEMTLAVQWHQPYELVGRGSGWNCGEHPYAPAQKELREDDNMPWFFSLLKRDD